MVSVLALLVAFVIPMCLGVVPPPPPGLGPMTMKQEIRPPTPTLAEVEAMAKTKTVVVFIGAEWDATGKVIDKTVFQADAFAKLLETHDARLVRLDFTERDPQVVDWLKKLGQVGVPVTAIFPAGKPKERRVLDATVTLETLEAALEAASKAKQ